MMKLDMWYGDKQSEIDMIDIFFYPESCEYRGNVYKGGKAVGDYVCNDSVELQKAFGHLQFQWD